jgi:heme-degrading monooxygenase HmoA
MPYLLVKHAVRDFAAWRRVFDEAMERKGLGSRGGFVFQGLDDPNQVFVLLEWDDPERMKAFMASEGLRQAMDRGGVTGRPDVHFLDLAERVGE